MPTTPANGLRIYYELDQRGVPVVLIAGLTCDHTAWGPQVPDLQAAGFRCLAFDNRDVGQTDQGSAPYSIREFAADTAGLMDALGLPAAHIVGASMGGMIAQEIALAHPQRVRSLTLVCTAALTDPTLARVIRAWQTLRPPASPVELTLAISPWLFTHRFFQQPEPLEGVLQMVADNPFPQTPAGFKRQCEAVLSHDALDRVGTIGVPTHVIVGAEDVLTPPRSSRTLAELISGARLTEIPAAGHGLFWENVAEFNRAVIRFLEEVDETARTRNRS